MPVLGEEGLLDKGPGAPMLCALHNFVCSHWDLRPPTPNGPTTRGGEEAWVLDSKDLTWPSHMRLSLEPSNSRCLGKPSEKSSPYLPPDNSQEHTPHGQECEASSEVTQQRKAFRVQHQRGSLHLKCLPCLAPEGFKHREVFE